MIVNLFFEKISAEKKKEVLGNIEAKTQARIVSVEEQALEALGVKQPALNIRFSFTLTYEPDVALIDIAGRVIDLVEEKEKKAILDQWKKEEKIDPKYATRIMNALLLKCNVRALSLSNELNLPSPIPLPRLAKKGQIQKKEGKK